MFPLSLVLLPGVVVPLRLFEDRYLELFDDLVAGDQRFGIVLIERGAETGGNDVRASTACVARMVGSSPQDDGTVLTLNVGMERVRIVEWLEDDPYPMALVERLEDGVPTAAVESVVEDCRLLLASVRDLAAELGAEVGVEPSLSDDPIRATFQIASLAPLQAFDQQKVLEADDPLVRAQTLRAELVGMVEMLTLELAVGR
jgi:hypothetical protein